MRILFYQINIADFNASWLQSDQNDANPNQLDNLQHRALGT